MKNACIVWKEDIQGLFERQTASVRNAFEREGYAFDEYRALAAADETAVLKAVQNLLSTHENIIILANFSKLSRVKNVLSAVFSEEAFQGTASGVGLFVKDRQTVFLLAVDEPQWGETYVKEVCLPHLQRKYNARLQRTVIRSIGANAQHVQSLLAQIRSLGQGMLSCVDEKSFGEDVICVYYDENIPKRIADDAIRVLVEGLGDSVYAVDDVSIAQQLVSLLSVRGKKISVAESFTGGGVAKNIVNIPGASAVYFEGLNTYNELSKIQRLGVSDYTLNSYGAVSDQTAYEMAAGLIATGNCDICIATTGIAGPKSDRSMLPVGLCYIAIGTKEKVFVYRYIFDGDREEITETAIKHALFLAYKQLKNM